MMAGRLNRRPRGPGRHTGSALILTVVLTTLLAMIGVLFVMAARLDKMGTTATAESRELDFAVDSVVAQISEALADDVPGVSVNQEYYDYPDANNLWLADLEPSRTADGDYVWRQISNLGGAPASDINTVTITVMRERDTITDVNYADADGDGVSDARWYQIPGVVSSKGKPMYAAVRIVDNGGMLNINTGWWFDSEWPEKSRVDGNSPRQINAATLAGGVASLKEGADALLQARAITDTVNGLALYEDQVIWGYLLPDPCNAYTPFDLSDELELRYRFILNHGSVDTLAEEWGRFKDNRTISVPVDANVPKWFGRAADGLDPNYAYRHVATTYNMDRIITPKSIQANRPGNPWKMVDVNAKPPNVLAIREAIALALGGNDPDAVAVAAAAQITANLLDYIDDDDDQVTAVPGPGSSPVWYYGFERPCIYISEIACNLVPDSEDPNIIYKSYAIELYKPYFEDNDPKSEEWQLVITPPSLSDPNVIVPIVWQGTRRFQVVLLEDPAAELFDDSAFSDPAAADDTTNPKAQIIAETKRPAFEVAFDEGSTISLERKAAPTGLWIPDVDSVKVPTGWMVPNIDPNAGPPSIQRDVSPHKCIRRLWSLVPEKLGLGSAPEPDLVTRQPEAIIQAHPANRPLTNIGELGMVFAKSAYDANAVKDAVAADVLFDLKNPNYARVFNYLTVMDPANHGWDLNETRVMGRINVNTAPWFVLGQLPWIQYEDSVTFEKARAIVNDRNAKGAYESTADLMRVESLGNLTLDGPKQNWHDDTPRGPDLDAVPDTALDDFEERDLIFRRISDLVTVRSDVFTAYILVRLGLDGPQKRVMALLDRSEVTPEGGQVRVRALHPVPDPR